MTTPLHLPYADVVAAAARAYDEGRLQAQTAPSGRCSYRSPHDNSPCAVGAAMAQSGLSLMAFNHAFTLAFEVISDDPEGDDVTPDMMRAALLKRIENLDQEQTWEEATGAPYDTYEVTE